MRTITGGEAAVLTAAAFHVFHRIQVTDGDGAYQNLSALGSATLDYVVGFEVDTNIDQPVAQATVLLRRDEEPAASVLSLSPLRDDSVLNRKADTTYAPLLDPGRKLRIEVAEITYGTSPVAGDWKRLFDGYIDVVEFNEPVIRVIARDQGAQIVDQSARVPASFDYTSAPKPLEDLITEILDREFGVGVVPLYTPASPGYNVKTFRHDRESIMDILQRLVQNSAAWDIRYWWHEASTAFRLTLKNPNRTKVVPDETLGGDMYLGARALKIDRTNVRNRIEVTFGPPTARQTGTADDATSQARFGYRVLHIEEASDSPITTLTEANNMAAAILSDLALPKADLEVEMLLYWPVELFDLVRFSSNTIHFNSNQDLAVVGVRHSGMAENDGVKFRTFLQVRGKPAGSYLTWQFTGFLNPDPGRTPPFARIAFVSRTRQFETVSLEGSVGASDLLPLQWRYRVGSADYGAWSAAALPSSLSVSRTAYYSTSIGLQVRQSDLQVRDAYYSAPPFMDDGSSVDKADDARSGKGGVPTKVGSYGTTPSYNDDGSTPFWDPFTKKILPGLGIGNGVRGESDVSFGGAVKYAVNRHNELKIGVDGSALTFSTSYEQVPEIRVLPQTWKSATAGNAIEFKVINPTVSGGTLRCKEISGQSSAAQSDDCAATLNGTPVGAGITIGAPSSVAYANLSNANANPTTYKAFFDVNTTAMVGGGLLRVTAYVNDGTASTNWTQVGQRVYDVGLNLTGEHIDFDAALAQNWDVRLLVSYSFGTPSVNATVVADRVDYDKITAGTETDITNTAHGAVLVQTVEKS